MKKLALIMTVILLMLTVTSCNSSSTASSPDSPSNKSSSPTSESQETSVPKPDPNKTYEVSYYSFWCGDLDDGSYVEKLIEENVGGIDIKVRKIGHQNTDQVNLMLSTNDMPDCGWFNFTPSYMQSQELIRTIPVEMVKEYMPNFIRQYDRVPIMYPLTLSPDNPDEFVCLSGIGDSLVNLHLPCDFYRYDWIKKLNIDLGDIKVEKLSDNIYIADKGVPTELFMTIMDGFVNNDPDGNGKKDTIGACVGAGSKEWMSAFDLIQGNSNVNGTATMWYADARYKETLKFMKTLYDRGLVDKEWATLPLQSIWEKINTGTAGYFQSGTNHVNSWASNRPPLALIEKEPTAELLMTPGLRSKSGHTYRMKSTSPQNGTFYINKDVSDDKLAKILQFEEYANFGKTLAAHWNGEENVDWKWDGDTPKKINVLAPGERGTQTFCQYMQVEKPWEWITYEPVFFAGAKYYDSSTEGIWNKDLIYSYKDDIKKKGSYGEIFADVGPTLNQIVDAYTMDCVLGKKDIDGTWDSYIKELEDAGYIKLQKALEETEIVEDTIKEYSK